jgi:hypothetical protein
MDRYALSPTVEDYDDRTRKKYFSPVSKFHQ